MKNVTFAWSNYTRPTPKNLEFIFELLEDTLKLITGFSIWEKAEAWVPLSILVFAFVCGKFKKFFATIAHGDQDTVSVSYPSELSDQVEVKQESKTINE